MLPKKCTSHYGFGILIESISSSIKSILFYFIRIGLELIYHKSNTFLNIRLHFVRFFFVSVVSSLINSYDVTMMSYCLYNFIVINLAEVSRFSNLVLNLKVPTKSFPKMYYLLWLVLYFLL